MSGVEKPLAISEFTNSSNELQFSAQVYLVRSAASFSNYMSQSFSKHLDEMSSVFVTKSDAAKCKIFNGSILQIKPTVTGRDISIGAIKSQLPTNETSVKNDKMYVTAVVCDAVSICPKDSGRARECICFNDEVVRSRGKQGINNDKLHISMSRSLWFNICQKYSITTSTPQLQCILMKCTFDKPELSHSPSSTTEMRFASQLTISPILSPSYNLTVLYDDILTSYFSKPRLMHIGDVFFIKSRVDSLVIYFKVQCISPMIMQPCYVDNVHTSLFMDSAVQSLVPPCMSSSSTETLPVLSKYCVEICSRLHPFIEGQRKMAPASGLYPFILLSGPSGCGKSSVAKDVAERLHLHYFVVHCSSLVSDTALAFETKLKQAIRLASTYKPCILLLKSVNLIKDRSGQDDSRLTTIFFSVLRGIIDQETLQSSCSKPWPIAVIATITADKLLSTEFHQGFLDGIHMNVPDLTERLMLLTSLLPASIALSPDVQLRLVAQRTAGMVIGDIAALLNLTKKIAKERIQELDIRSDARDSLEYRNEEELLLKSHSFKLIQADFEMALNHLHSAHADAIGAPKVPNVSWADVGGLERAKLDILDTIQLPLQHPELLAVGLNRSGILLYGPPGTGKTLLAKAVATECNINFLSVKGPELLNMYVGQSEENVREVFTRASAAAPCVIFFDELDSLAPNRGRSGDSGGVMDRVVSQLLSELDGLQKSTDVFVIGATNRPDLIDPALLRPGRFDKLIHLGICSNKKSQLSVMKALTRRFDLDPDCKLESVVERCEGKSLSGADFYAVCSDALLNAVKRIIEQDSSQDANDVQLKITAEDFYQATSSVTSIQSNIESYQ